MPRNHSIDPISEAAVGYAGVVFLVVPRSVSADSQAKDTDDLVRKWPIRTRT